MLKNIIALAIATAFGTAAFAQAPAKPAEATKPAAVAPAPAATTPAAAPVAATPAATPATSEMAVEAKPTKKSHGKHKAATKADDKPMTVEKPAEAKK